MEKLCKCNCGMLVTKENNIYILGHNSRINDSKFWLNSKDSIQKRTETIRKQFDNGKKSWNIGLTKENDYRIEKMANSLMGRSGWNTGLTKDTDMRVRRISESKIGHFVSIETREKIRNNFLDKTYEELYGKEKALNMRYKNSISKRGKIPKNLLVNIKCNNSFKQNDMFMIVKKYYPSAVKNLRVGTLNTYRFLDVAIPELKLDFEYNGKVHLMKNVQENDVIRTKELIQLGWKVIVFDKNNFSNLENICRDLCSAI